jgi:hypothetical protein
MATMPAIRTSELPDTEIARLLARRYRDLLECFDRRGVLVDPDNLHERATRLDTPLTEAVRRLKRTP